MPAEGPAVPIGVAARPTAGPQTTCADAFASTPSSFGKGGTIEVDIKGSYLAARDCEYLRHFTAKGRPVRNLKLVTGKSARPISLHDQCDNFNASDHRIKPAG